MKVLLAVLVVVLISLQYRVWFGSGSLQEVWRLKQQAREKSAEAQRLRNRNDTLAAEVADLKKGLDAIEERARAELGMIGADETFYQFVRKQGRTPAVLPSTVVVPRSSESNPERSSTGSAQ